MMFCDAGAQPVYSPNSYGGPEADPTKAPPSWWVEAGEVGHYEYEQHRDDGDFIQAGTLYRGVLDPTDREHLAANIVAHASDGVSPEVQARVTGYWTNVDAELGARVAAGLASGNSVVHPVGLPRDAVPAEG
jgi:catalase